MSFIISKIEQQKKNKKRYSLFAGDEFILGVSEETIISFDLHQGKKISESFIEEIKTKEQYISIREQAWRFLSRRDHSWNELKEKLAQKAYDQDMISEILRDLNQRDYLNDGRYASQVINDEINLKRNGPLLIKNKLVKKGVDINIINELLEEMYPEERQIVNCSRVSEKKHKMLHKLDAQSTKKRLISYLAQKGYTWEIIEKIL